MNCLRCSLVFVLAATSSALLGQTTPDPESFRPDWNVGDRWTVEAKSETIHNANPRQVVTRWEFHVVGVEPLEGRPRFRVDVSLVAPVKRPALVTFYVDQASMALDSVVTRAQFAGRTRALTESFSLDSGQPSPVIASTSPVPIAIPLFQSGVKGIESFSYETGKTDSRKKGADLSFRHSISQQMTGLTPDAPQVLENMEFAKGLAQPAFTEVKLTSNREVRQTWQAGLPWPLLTEDGEVVARLVDIQRQGN